MTVALVTGGGGFLGRALVDRLLARGDSVRSFSRASHPELAAKGVLCHRGDLADAAAVARAVAGVDVVYHVAAKAGVWGPFREFYAANVVGTKNVIDACLTRNVPRLVYTSSPSVVFDGRDMEGADESAPYPKHFKAHYPRTKAEAERLVLAANQSSLATVALRPHLIWGPGDNHLTPRILERGRSGRLRRIGEQNKLIDATYIDNAALAHVLAADRLSPGAAVAGKAYFIAQGEPIPIWDLINRILEAGGLPPVTKKIAPPMARFLGALCELVYGVIPAFGEPPLTRFVVAELSTAHWFDLTAARRDLGYEAEVSTEEGIKRLREWLRASRGT